ncbi:hypothetical protein KTT_29120 [Tengunoibacter tsumagoiensis]|uniref:Uncharacterized protein n=1 Tax=Tengunoibacter tsumagoiensis TaxID=2014871 RepID=A0A402A1N2_9CHLR|nr:hypothetical protein KTT_29120 [Tengunoibacter tsumagoiensis]
MLSGPNQQGEFYHDSTAAFQVNQQYSVIPGSQPRQISQAMPVLPTHGEQKAYSPSQSTDRTATTSGITASQKAQTYPVNNPGSGSKTNQHRTIQRQPHSAIVMTICICLVIALISIIGLLTYMWSLGNHNGDTAQPSHPTTPVTGAPSITPTQLSTPTTVVTPTPSLDSGFTWCSSTCTTADFMTEYPTRWIVTTLPMPGNGMQISNASQSHTMASFKAELPPTSTTTASEILLNEITMNYARNPGYQASNSNQTATICGETWTTAILYYQDNAQKERVEVYATIHNSKAYVIALQAPDDQFDTIYSQYYSAMLNKYQFLPSGTA